MSRRPVSHRRFAQFCRRAWDLVARIPRGRVMTYGGIAERIPAPRGMSARAYRRVRARWVGYALARCPEGLPWQRVVNAEGRISPRFGHGPHVQRLLLLREGVRPGRDGRIRLERYAWHGPSAARRRSAAPKT